MTAQERKQSNTNFKLWINVKQGQLAPVRKAHIIEAHE
jgi:hypothetical protein